RTPRRVTRERSPVGHESAEPPSGCAPALLVVSPTGSTVRRTAPPPQPRDAVVASCNGAIRNAPDEVFSNDNHWELAPQAGFEPATLRLTGGKNVVSCS